MSEHTSGVELDELIAIRVMGWYGIEDAWHPAFRSGINPETGARENIPRYSTDIAAAWGIVDQLVAATGYAVFIEAYSDRVVARLMRWGQSGGWSGWIQATDEGFEAYSAAHAICLAALAAVSKSA